MRKEFVNCFQCEHCKRNGNRNPEIIAHAAYCDNPSIPNNTQNAEYVRASGWYLCDKFKKRKMTMSAILKAIG